MAVLLHAVPLAGVCRKERSSPVPQVRAWPEEMRCAPHSRPPPSSHKSVRLIAPRVPALQVPGGRAFGYPKQ